LFGGGGRKMETEDEEELGPERIFEIYRKDWLMMWGRNGARSFEAESTYSSVGDFSRLSSIV